MKFSPPVFQPPPAISTTDQATLKVCQQENAYLKRQLTLYKALLAAKAETIRRLRNQPPLP